MSVIDEMRAIKRKHPASKDSPVSELQKAARVIALRRQLKDYQKLMGTLENDLSTIDREIGRVLDRVEKWGGDNDD